MYQPLYGPKGLVIFDHPYNPAESERLTALCAARVVARRSSTLGVHCPGCAVGHWTSVTRWGAAGAAFVTASIRWLAAARLSHLDRDTTAMRLHESTHWAGQRALASSPRTPGECDAWRLWPVRVRAESGLAQYFWTTLILYGHSVRISR